jgi:hypothetical protein
MSRSDFEADWTPYRDALVTRFPKLTEAELADADGNVSDLAVIIAAHDGTTPSEAQQALEEFLGGPMPADAYAAPQHDDAAARAAADYVPDGEDPLSDDRRFGDDDVPDRPIGRTGT